MTTEDKVIDIAFSRLDRFEQKIDTLLEWANKHEAQHMAYRTPALWAASIIGSVITAYLVTTLVK